MPLKPNREAVVLVVLVACGARTELGQGHPTSLDAARDVAADSGAETEPPPPPPPPPRCTLTAQTELGLTAWEVDEIVVDGAFLYFHDDVGVSRVPKSGGAVTPVTPMPYFGWPLYARFAVTATNVTWVTWLTIGSESTLASAPLGGGSSTVIATLVPYFVGVTATAGALFVWQTEGPARRLDRVASGIATTLTSALPFGTMRLITADGSVFYGASDAVGLYVFDGQAVTTLGTAPAADLTADDATLFFTQAFGTTVPVAVWRVEKGDASKTALATTNDVLGGIAVDEAHVYFANRDKGNVERVGKHGEARTVVGGKATTQPIGIALDDACVYWTAFDNNGPGGHVFGAPK